MKLLCPHCHSENITRDACAAWNPETNNWELSGVYDDMSCNDCGEDFNEAKEAP